MSSAFVIGGAGFVGRKAVAIPFENGYVGPSVSREAHSFRFADRPVVPDARLAHA